MAVTQRVDTLARVATPNLSVFATRGRRRGGALVPGVSTDPRSALATVVLITVVSHPFPSGRTRRPLIDGPPTSDQQLDRWIGSSRNPPMARRHPTPDIVEPGSAFVVRGASQMHPSTRVERSGRCSPERSEGEHRPGHDQEDQCESRCECTP